MTKTSQSLGSDCMRSTGYMNWEGTADGRAGDGEVWQVKVEAVFVQGPTKQVYSLMYERTTYDQIKFTRCGAQLVCRAPKTFNRRNGNNSTKLNNHSKINNGARRRQTGRQYGMENQGRDGTLKRTIPRARTPRERQRERGSPTNTEHQ